MNALAVGTDPAKSTCYRQIEVNAAAPQDGNVKFTVMPNGSGEGARRADACAPFGFVIAESSLRRLR